MKKSLVSQLSLLALLMFVVGCSVVPKPKAMTVENLSLGRRFNKSVEVKVAGGQDPSQMAPAQIPNKDLSKAISDSLQANGLFSSVVNTGQGDFVFNATVVNLNQPMMGFTMTVGVEIVWSLTPKGQSEPIWEKAISSRVSKTVGDAFAGMTRVRIATEAAVQENIRQALTELSRVKLPEGS